MLVQIAAWRALRGGYVRLRLQARRCRHRSPWNARSLSHSGGREHRTYEWVSNPHRAGVNHSLRRPVGAAGRRTTELVARAGSALEQEIAWQHSRAGAPFTATTGMGVLAHSERVRGPRVPGGMRSPRIGTTEYVVVKPIGATTEGGSSWSGGAG